MIGELHKKALPGPTQAAEQETFPSALLQQQGKVLTVTASFENAELGCWVSIAC